MKVYDTEDLEISLVLTLEEADWLMNYCYLPKVDETVDDENMRAEIFCALMDRGVTNTNYLNEQLKPFVGLWVHLMDDKELIHQGQFIEYKPHGILVVQLYSFITGEPTDELELDGGDTEWVLYKTDEDMRKGFDRYAKETNLFNINFNGE